MAAQSSNKGGWSRAVLALAGGANNSLLVLSYLAVCGTIAGLIGALHPVLDLFSHFRLQYFLWLTVFTCVCILQKRRKSAWVLGCAAAVNAVLLAILWLPADKVAKTSDAIEVSVLDMNLFFRNRDFTRVINQVNECSPDVMILEELTPELLTGLQPVLKKYPYQLYHLREDPFGIGIFSKYKLTKKDDNPLHMQMNFVIRAEASVQGTPLTITAVHTLPPLQSVYWSYDQDLCNKLSQYNQTVGKNALLAGDLNATPWSALFHRIQQSADYKDSERGFGLQCSWPTDCAVLMVPIDHILVSKNITVMNRRLLANVSSDHRPVFATLAIPRE